MSQTDADLKCPLITCLNVLGKQRLGVRSVGLPVVIRNFQAAASYYTECFKMQALFDLMGVRYVDTEMKMTPF